MQGQCFTVIETPPHCSPFLPYAHEGIKCVTILVRFRSLQGIGRSHIHGSRWGMKMFCVGLQLFNAINKVIRTFIIVYYRNYETRVYGRTRSWLRTNKTGFDNRPTRSEQTYLGMVPDLYNLQVTWIPRCILTAWIFGTKITLSELYNSETSTGCIIRTDTQATQWHTHS